MRSLRVSLVIAVCAAVTGGALLAEQGAPVAANDSDRATDMLALLTRAHDASRATPERGRLSARTRRELARARRATAKYHDLANAEADGYVNGNLYTSGEGHHYINPDLVDGNFNPEQPEVLLYANGGGGDGLRLVAVEYLVPNTLPTPEGFTGGADVWQSEEPFPLWALNAWIWLDNPDGIFTFLNPRVP